MYDPDTCPWQPCGGVDCREYGDPECAHLDPASEVDSRHSIVSNYLSRDDGGDL